jgi:hypothetical protein
VRRSTHHAAGRRAGLGCLSGLTRLDYHVVAWEKAPADFITALLPLTGLRHLALGSISGILPPESYLQLSALRSLTALVLAGRHLPMGGVLGDLVGALPLLRGLRLWSELVKIEGRSTPSLTQLTTLGLNGDAASLHLWAREGALRGLRELRFTRYTCVNAFLISIDPSLADVDRIELQPTLRLLAGACPQLHTLRMDAMRVPAATLRELSRLSGLTELLLVRANNLGSAELGCLVEGLAGLRRLSLNQTVVDDAGLLQLSGLRGLTFLRLARSALATATGYAAALPALQGLKHLALMPLPFLSAAELGSLLESMPALCLLETAWEPLPEAQLAARELLRREQLRFKLRPNSPYSESELGTKPAPHLNATAWDDLRALQQHD